MTINEYPFFTKEEVITKLVELKDDGAFSFDITFGVQDSIFKADETRALFDLELTSSSFLIPDPDLDVNEEHIPSLSFDDISHITAL